MEQIFDSNGNLVVDSFDAGYWARVQGASLEDMERDGEREEGWNQADKELKAKVIQWEEVRSMEKLKRFIGEIGFRLTGWDRFLAWANSDHWVLDVFTPAPKEETDALEKFLN